jgi:hypothetical protein
VTALAFSAPHVLASCLPMMLLALLRLLVLLLQGRC